MSSNFKRQTFGIFLCFFGLGVGYAQQQPLFTQYMFNTAAINPAYVGTQPVPTFTVLAREQWSGIKGSPSTQTLTADVPIKYSPAAWGAMVFNDQFFSTSQTGVFGMYSYRIQLGFAKLAMGLKVGATNYRTDLSDLNIDFEPVSGGTMVDPSFSENVTEWVPNVGMGLFLHDTRWFLGLSIPEMVHNNIQDGDIQIKQERHFYVHGGSVFFLNEVLSVRPGFLVRGVQAAPAEIDVSVNFLYRNMFWVGGSYRLGNTFNLLFELDLNQSLRLGYAHDLASNKDVGPFQNSSHEIMLSYRLFKDKSIISSPRYF